MGAFKFPKIEPGSRADVILSITIAFGSMPILAVCGASAPITTIGGIVGGCFASLGERGFNGNWRHFLVGAAAGAAIGFAIDYKADFIGIGFRSIADEILSGENDRTSAIPSGINSRISQVLVRSNHG